MISVTSFIDLRRTIILVLFCPCMIISCSDDDAPQDIPLVISGISPSSGPKNTSVTITGNGFSATSAENVVTLNGKSCPITSASITELKVTIPAGGGSGKLAVKVNDKSAETPEFTYILSLDEIPLMISGISPISGPKNTSVTITGNGFSATSAENVVTLNGKSCPVTSASITELKITIPAGGGSGKLAVKVNDKSAETPEFTYILSLDEIPLMISGISPISGPKTTIVTITGSGFSTNATENVVTLNNIPCPVIAASPLELKVTIPAKAGSGKLLLNVYGKTGETPQFTYVYSQVTITTLAGSTKGDGNKFQTPGGVALDKDGNVYVPDWGNFKVKKITPSGAVSTFAGSTQGDGDKFNTPQGVAVDKDGNVYVADRWNHKIKKITPSGVVSTFAGSTLGDGDKFNEPVGVAVDRDGNVYVTDLKNYKIKKITPSGVVSTFAGSTKGDGDKFSFPFGIAVDEDGNVYVADLENDKIKKITPSGVVSTFAGSTKGDGDKFDGPRAVAVDKDDNIYVADGNNHKIKKITPSGVVSTVAGSTEGDGDQFNFPSGVAVDKDDNVYVADTENNKIKKIEQE